MELRILRTGIALTTACTTVASALLGFPSAAQATPVAPRVDVVALTAAPPIPISQAVSQLKAAKSAARDSGSVADVICFGDPVTLKSAANGKYVSAELGWDGDRYGMLRARATEVGPWEKYALCQYSSPSEYWQIASVANIRAISAELGWDGDRYGMLRARATEEGPWERYMVTPNGSTLTIKSLANDRYVSAELGWDGDRYGMLRARATEVGPWERFL